MKLSELAGSSAKLSSDHIEVEISGITASSRDVKPGMLFAAMPGTVVDGAEFIPAAISAGAAAILAADDATIENCPVPVLRANNPRVELAILAARFYGKQPGVMAAVTGTAGKTSVASFLRQIWQSLGFEAAMIGTTGVTRNDGTEYGSLTTPDPVKLQELLRDLAEDNVTHCSMEASSHGLDQHRLDGVRLSAGAFTNLGRDHLDYHPDIEHYLEAKMILFRERLSGEAPAIIYADDEFSRRVIATASEAGRVVFTVGRKGEFLAVKRVEQHQYGQTAEIVGPEGSHRVDLPMAGEFQLANALVAAGLAISLGGDETAVMKALEKLKGAPGRLELIGKTRNGCPAYVDYAHKPEALENVLKALRPYTTGKLVVVFGCGGDRDPGKRPIMGGIAADLADRVIVTDDNPRSEDPASIRQAIMTTARGATEIGDRREAINLAVAELQKGDCLVVAGKGHEEGQIVGDKILPFSDHDVLRSALEATR